MAKTARLELRIEPELLARVDAARGDVKRATFVERALESVLDGGAETGTLQPPPAPTRAPGDPAAVKAKREAPPDRRVKGSTEARPFRPVPKAGKR